MNSLPPMPLVIRLYVAMCCVALAWFVLSFLPQFGDVTAQTHPYIGWSGTFTYVFSLIPIATAYLSKSGHRPRLQFLVLFPLLTILTSALEIYTVLLNGNQHTDSVYLWMHPYRPVFSIALPALWLAAFSMPNVQRWFADVSTASLAIREK